MRMTYKLLEINTKSIKTNTNMWIYAKIYIYTGNTYS